MIAQAKPFSTVVKLQMMQACVAEAKQVPVAKFASLA
jgi:hypothetical protein